MHKRIREYIHAYIPKYMNTYIHIYIHTSMQTYIHKTDISIVPSNMWGGVGYLGLVIRFYPIELAMQNNWHVLEVEPDSQLLG